MSELADHVAGLRAVLVEGPVGPTGHDPATDADRVDLIAALEQLKSAACAAQSDLAIALHTSVRAEHAADSLPARQRGRGVAAQVALARQVSPHRGQVLLGFAKDLATDLPATRQALRDGRLDEHRAMIVARDRLPRLRAARRGRRGRLR